VVSTRKKRYETDTYPQRHDRTPTRVRVQNACDLIDSGLASSFKSRIFRAYNVSHSNPDPRRLHNSTVRRETRGVKKIINERDIRAMEIFLKKEGFEARKLNWAQLGEACGVKAHGRTIKRAMGSMGYHKCISCAKGWVTPTTAEARVTWATDMLAKYPMKEDWRNVRFSDECHWSYRPEGKARIIRKARYRLCVDCIQQQEVPTGEDRYRVHSWAAVGYNFKSQMYFYNVPGNKNGKISHNIYINQILEVAVKPWLRLKLPFVLEEDGDSGHGYGGKYDNKVKKWKRSHSLVTYQNFHNSPDLSPIENCWQLPKQVVRQYAH
jgi:hypothetical protein